MTSELQADAGLGWCVEASGERLTAREIKEIARAAGMTAASVIARIKRGETGEYLRRPREPQGRRSSAHQVQPTLPVRGNAHRQSLARPEQRLTSEIKQEAAVLGIPPRILAARAEAGWPVDRLLDPVRR